MNFKGNSKKRVIPVILFIIMLIAVIGGIVVYRKIPKQISKENLQYVQKITDEEKTDEEDVEMSDSQTYVENQVVAVANSKREAKKIANQIGGELLSYDNQVAVIRIGITVEEMMQRLEEDPSLPKVYPNYQGYTIQ